jgi:hypothetical protein
MLPKNLSEYRYPLVLVMGILFFAAGFFLLCQTPHKFYQRSILIEAEQVSATILEVDKINRRKHTSITGKYEYFVDGQRYESSQLAIFAETESLYQRLLAAKEEQRQVICFVDPSNPGVSALDLDWRFLDILVYNVLGLPFLYFGSVYLFRHFKWRIHKTDSPKK